MNIGKFKSEGERYDIAVRFLERGRNGMERLDDLWVPASKGPPQELRNLAYVVPSEALLEIDRYNRQRVIRVYANLESVVILLAVEGRAREGCVGPGIAIPGLGAFVGALLALVGGLELRQRPRWRRPRMAQA